MPPPSAKQMPSLGDQRNQSVGTNSARDTEQRKASMTRRSSWEDMWSQMCCLEVERMPNVRLMDKQEHLTWDKRAVLLDHLVHLLSRHQEYFQLAPNDLFLAVNILDRYCSKKMIKKEHCFSAAFVALIIAVKFEDGWRHAMVKSILEKIYQPVCDRRLLALMEWDMLKSLEWEVRFPTVLWFMNLASDNLAPGLSLTSISQYLAEISLYQRSFVAQKPSLIAASLTSIAKCIYRGDKSLPESVPEDIRTLVVQGIHWTTKVLSIKYEAESLRAKEFLETRGYHKRT